MLSSYHTPLFQLELWFVYIHTAYLPIVQSVAVALVACVLRPVTKKGGQLLRGKVHPQRKSWLSLWLRLTRLEDFWPWNDLAPLLCWRWHRLYKLFVSTYDPLTKKLSSIFEVSLIITSSHMTCHSCPCEALLFHHMTNLLTFFALFNEAESFIPCCNENIITVKALRAVSEMV